MSGGGCCHPGFTGLPCNNAWDGRCSEPEQFWLTCFNFNSRAFINSCLENFSDLYVIGEERAEEMGSHIHASFQTRVKWSLPELIRALQEMFDVLGEPVEFLLEETRCISVEYGRKDVTPTTLRIRSLLNKALSVENPRSSILNFNLSALRCPSYPWTDFLLSGVLVPSNASLLNDYHEIKHNNIYESVCLNCIFDTTFALPLKNFLLNPCLVLLYDVCTRPLGEVLCFPPNLYHKSTSIAESSSDTNNNNNNNNNNSDNVEDSSDTNSSNSDNVEDDESDDDD